MFAVNTSQFTMWVEMLPLKKEAIASILQARVSVAKLERLDKLALVHMHQTLATIVVTERQASRALHAQQGHHWTVSLRLK